MTYEPVQDLAERFALDSDIFPYFGGLFGSSRLFLNRLRSLLEYCPTLIAHKIDCHELLRHLNICLVTMDVVMQPTDRPSRVISLDNRDLNTSLTSAFLFTRHHQRVFASWCVRGANLLIPNR